jgi:two-component system phosphate regulon sensor histidine kinase PhoR
MKLLRLKVVFPFIVLTTAIFLALSIYLSNLISQVYEEAWRTNLVGETQLLAVELEPLFGAQATADQFAQLAQEYAAHLDRRVTIIQVNGVVLADTGADPRSMENHFTRPEVQQAMAGRTGFQVRHSETLNIDMMYVAVPIHEGEAVAGIARLAVPFVRLDSILANVRSALLVILAISLLLLLGFGYLMTSVTLRPLENLTRAARDFSEGGLKTIQPLDSQDEIGQLGRALRDMGIRLDDQITALKSERGRLAAVLAEMTDGVLIANPQDEVELLNPAAARIFNVQESAALGKSVVEIVRHHQIVDLWRRCKETSDQQVITLEVSAGHLFLQCIASPLSSELPGSTLLLVQDLTRLRRLETVRRDFISNVSHELRTPLAGLKAIAETLRESALEDPPAARRFLTRMETEIDTLTQLVRELLELSRIESGKVPLQRKPISPCSLLAPGVERMHLQAERAHLILQNDCPADLPLVSADAERMGQVLVNLLHNAIKFTPPNGRIVTSAYHHDREVIFTVTDSGVGISQEDLGRIFERFYKADRARSGGGTGLGLSIARHMVEAHGGRIWAESTPGGGSIFSFSLPTA